MDIWKYTPKSIKRRVLKKLAGFHRNKSQKLIDRSRAVISQRDLAYTELEKQITEKKSVYGDLEKQVERNTKLSTQVQELAYQVAETSKAAKEAIKYANEIKSIGNTHAAQILSGRLPYLLKHEPEALKGLDINEGLLNANRNLAATAEREMEKNDDLIRQNFKYEMRELCRDKPEVARASVMIYDGKEIHYINDKIPRRLGLGEYNLAQELGKDETLQKALGAGENAYKDFGKYNMLFVPVGEKGEGVSAAYIVPKEKGRKAAKAFSKIGRRAVRLIRKNIESIPVSTRGLEWNLGT